jgi:hypothetical protein
MEGKPVRNQALHEKTLACPNHLALADAELLRDGGIGPEGTAISVCSQVEEEQKGDLLQAQTVEDVPETMVDPGKMTRDRADLRSINRLTIRHRGAHARGVYPPDLPEGREPGEEIPGIRGRSG